jgi:hypothetical protein
MVQTVRIELRSILRTLNLRVTGPEIGPHLVTRSGDRKTGIARSIWPGRKGDADVVTGQDRPWPY